MPTVDGLQSCSVADVTLRVKATYHGIPETYCDMVAYGGLRRTVLFPAAYIDYSPSWIMTGSPSLAGPGLLAFVVYQGPTGTPGLYYVGPANGFIGGDDPVWADLSSELASNAYAEAMPEASYVLANATLVAEFVDGELDCEVRFTTTRDESGRGVAQAYCDETLVEEYVTENAVDAETLVSKVWVVSGGQAPTSFPIAARPIEESFRVGPVAATVWDTEGSGVNEEVVLSGGAPGAASPVSRSWADWAATWTDGHPNTTYRSPGDLYFLPVAVLSSANLARWAVDAEGYFYGPRDDTEPYSDLGEKPGLFALYAYAYGSSTPNLSITHHPVSNTLLVGDAGLGTQAGHHKIQRKAASYEWSARIPAGDLTGTAPVTWQSILAVGSRIDFVFGTADSAKVAPGASLDGAWGTAKLLVGETAPFVVAAGQRLLLGTVNEGKARLTVRAQGEDYGAVDAAVEIGDSDAVPPVLARHPTLMRIFAAIQQAGNTVLHVSDDRGATWTQARTVTGLRYPYLYVDQVRVWLAGYFAGAYQGAQGTVRVSAYDVTKVLVEKTALAIVGPSDAGRPAIIRRPTSGELMVVAPKTGAFWDAAPGMESKGIAEYRSVDLALTWGLQAIHAVT